MQPQCRWAMPMDLDEQVQLDQRNTVNASSAAILVSRGATGSQTLALAHRLMAEASTQYPQLLDLRFIPISQSRLEVWAYRLAAEVVWQWRTLSVEDPTIIEILDELGLIAAPDGTIPLLNAFGKVGTDRSLLKVLDERIQSLVEQQQAQKLASTQLRHWLEQEAAHLADWFSQIPSARLERSHHSDQLPSPETSLGCLVQLQLYTPDLQNKTLHKLRACFVRLQRSGPQAILQRLGLLNQALQEHRQTYETQRQDFLRRESAAWRAYYNLIIQIEVRKWGGTGQGKLAWEAALRALSLAYSCKLEAEIRTLGYQLLGDLMQQVQRYAQSVAQTDTLLDQLNRWFVGNCPAEFTLSPLLKSFLSERINPWTLRRQMEKWSGYSLNQWGVAESLHREAIPGQILAQLHPICLSVYSECCTVIASELFPPSPPTQLNPDTFTGQSQEQ